MRYAQMQGGVVVTFLEGLPDNWPDLRDAGVLLACGEEVEAGWLWDGKAFAPPARSPAPRYVSALEFRTRFTWNELAAITTAAARSTAQGDPTLQMWLESTYSAVQIDLDDKDVAQGMALLVYYDFLAEARVAEILA